MTIQSLIDKALTPSTEPRKRSGRFSPSSFGRCFRAQVWNRQNITPTNPPDERVRRIFKVGELFHQFVQDTLLTYDPKLTKEVRVEYGDDFLGFADLVGDDCVFDVKSVHSRQFHYTRKKDFDISKEKKPNILQVCFYAWVLKKPKAQLVFVSKDDLCIEEYVFFVEKWLPELNHEIETLRDYWAKGLLPPAQPRAYEDKNGEFRECSMCGFLDRCKQKEGAE